MKARLLFILCVITLPVFAGKTARLTVNWTFTNVVEGYDHKNKMAVYVDGKLVGESAEFLQTSKASYSFDVPVGKHDVKIQNYAFYEGKWDVHSKANGYSVDAFYDGQLTFSKACTMDMKFDIDTETSDIKITGAKSNATAGVPLTLTWIFINVVEGYDHNNKMEIYCDGKLIGTSETFLESKKGTLTVSIPAGSHEINIINYAYYEGTWEAHTLENDYSIDATYTGNMTFKKKRRTANFVFDIDGNDSKFTIK